MSLLPKDELSRRYMLMGFKITGDFGATIAIPVILLVSIAQWYEGKNGGEPWFTVLAFAVAALVTIKMIIKKAKAYDKEYKKLNQLKKDNKELK